MSNGYYQFNTGRVAAIDGDCEFPPVCEALIEPNGLVAIGGDLTAIRLISAYRQGIFPWYNEGEPICWYSPNPRMVLLTNALKISKSLQKKLNANAFENRINTDFKAVITACSQTPRFDKINGEQTGTWISPDMVAAYCELNTKGYAISAETWQNGQLVGGCYGIKIGHMFYGESMFHTVRDASKVAFVHLVNYLRNQQVDMIDCQMKTPLLESFGGCEISRAEFIRKMNALL